MTVAGVLVQSAVDDAPEDAFEVEGLEADVDFPDESPEEDEDDDSEEVDDESPEDEPGEVAELDARESVR